MPRPDVAIIAPYPGLGLRHAGTSGVASYTANLAHALSGDGATVTVVAPVEHGQPATSIDGPVEVRRRFRPGALALPSAAQAAVATGARVIHLQHETFLYGGPPALAGLLPALARLRTSGGGPVVTLHQVVDPDEVDAAYTRLHRVAAPAALARLAIRALQEMIRRAAAATVVHETSFAPLVPGATVIPHGVEQRTTPDRSLARTDLGVAGDALTVLCFGFLAPYKGLETALAAAELAGPSVRLVVAGGEHPRLAGRDDYAAELRRRWAHVAHFTGWVPEDDVARWFAAADVALFPYPRPFASSGALALAIAHGTPALLSEPLATCAGLPAVTAVSAEPLPLAARLLELADDRAALGPLAAAISALAEERSWPAVARRHLDLYEEVIHGHRPRRRSVRTGQSG